MERNYLLCSLIAKYTALGIHDTDTLRYDIDEDLKQACQKPLGQEEGDSQFLNEYLAEIQIFVMGRGVNRKMRRSY